MSAVNLQTVTIEAGELVFDKNLTIGQVRKMSSSDGDIENVISVMATVIKAWPFEGPPSDTEAWDELTLPEFNEVIQAVTEGLGNALS